MSQKDTNMRATSISPPPSATTSFPMEVIETKLRDELIEAVKIEASIKGVPLPDMPAEIAKAAVHVDSLVALSILCTVEPIIGFELPDSMVRTGGYVSVERALEHLLLNLNKEWEKRKEAKP